VNIDSDGNYQLEKRLLSTDTGTLLLNGCNSIMAQIDEVYKVSLVPGACVARYHNVTTTSCK
jgi:hypothetical protein